MRLPVVAVVGRPNVGKSTLFNRLVGFKKAVVHDRPGVTRDRLYEETDVLERRVLLIDTGGIEPETESDLLTSMRRQSVVAIEEADVILLVVDGRAGITPADADVADLLRRSSKPVIVAVNKIDGPKQEDLAAEFWSMGMEPLLSVSAAHGRGIYELCAAVVDALPPRAEGDEELGTLLDEADEGGPIRIAVVGRPNIGKSTLVNALLGEERHVVDNVPGTTMDPVDSALQVDGRDYLLVDTAGVRKKARIGDQLERFVSLRAIRAIERCHVTLLMIDGTEGPTDQDAKLAQLVNDRGRALVVLVNKWDLTRDDPDIDARSTEDSLERRLPHATWAPHLFISAKTGKGLHRVLPMVDSVYAEFDRRITTANVNRFLEAAVAAHTPPQRYHHPVRLYYATQTRVRPPTFAVFSNTPDGVGPAYRRYLVNRLRDAFGFEGTPIRLHLKRRRKLGEEAG
ncbi:MAG: ribosome biogenesis GTPase Der [Myxococcales bacterium]|nr:ribosome biogenesis GTPase Der [Myxococcales bacterium]